MNTLHTVWTSIYAVEARLIMPLLEVHLGNPGLMEIKGRGVVRLISP
jgi:hypothetical protein